MTKSRRDEIMVVVAKPGNKFKPRRGDIINHNYYG
jgi:hypothetical protein